MTLSRRAFLSRSGYGLAASFTAAQLVSPDSAKAVSLPIPERTASASAWEVNLINKINRFVWKVVLPYAALYALLDKMDLGEKLSERLAKDTMPASSPLHPQPPETAGAEILQLH